MFSNPVKAGRWSMLYFIVIIITKGRLQWQLVCPQTNHNNPFFWLGPWEVGRFDIDHRENFSLLISCWTGTHWLSLIPVFLCSTPCSWLTLHWDWCELADICCPPWLPRTDCSAGCWLTASLPHPDTSTVEPTVTTLVQATGPSLLPPSLPPSHQPDSNFISYETIGIFQSGAGEENMLSFSFNWLNLLVFTHHLVINRGSRRYFQK